MTARVARWLIVWLVAWALRHGVSPSDALGTLAKSHRHQDADWRMAVVNDATIRNMRRAERKVRT